jgi:hypothetical protein
MKVRVVLALSLAVAACGDDDSSSDPDAGVGQCAVAPEVPAVGDDIGHPEPLGAGPAEARAGRIDGAALPAVASGLITWADRDFVLANDKVALVIEDVGYSHLYDPWGGRPVGMARVENGALVDPADFGEVLLLTGRSTVLTTAVSVVADGSDGGPAIVRATGKLAPLPFFDNITSALFGDGYEDVEAAIDYVLTPGAEKVDVVFRFASPRAGAIELPVTMHGFMYTKRTPGFTPDGGFTDSLDDSRYFALVDDDATSWAYFAGDGPLGPGISASGFVSGFTPQVLTIPACSAVQRNHASIVIGGPGLDGLVAAVARTEEQSLREITGTVRRGDAGVGGVRVHAVTASGEYLTRADSAADGSFRLHVPPATAVTLTASKLGDPLVRVDVAADATTAAIALQPMGAIRVTAIGADDQGLPVRVQILPASGGVERLPRSYGDLDVTGGRLHVAYPTTGDVTLPVPPGSWRVVASRGYEYDVESRVVDVGSGETEQVAFEMERVVDTTGVQCGDFHIHTVRSNDSNDDGLTKLASAVADGVEMPVRTDHDWVGDFAAEIDQLGVGRWATGLGSVELTSMELWGHMNVFPLQADLGKVNAGSPMWQSFGSHDDPDAPLVTMSPKTVFEQVRNRPERPTIIINHPRGGANYFTYVGLDAETGMPVRTADWDTEFTLVEVFNNSGWKDNLDGTVRDWFTLLRTGRKVFAVGSSDTHGITGSPVGYPRTCPAVGTDDPAALTPNQVRDTMAAGHSTVSGGIYVDARIGEAGPGDTASAGSSEVDVRIRVQAASWVDVDAIDVVVDGTIVDTIPLSGNGVVRFDDTVRVTVAPGSFVVVAAYGDAALEPVHPGRIPFGVTNPIFIGN